MSPKARLWLWLGAPLTTIVALLIGVVLSYRSDMTLRKPPLAPVLPLIVVCALLFQRLRKASWEFWKAIPSTSEKCSPAPVASEVELVRSA